ncbi:hypothetical protein PCURB6_05080 [Paenibacillus curdlanolyticus]|nr:hypothetical protein PCURB6_05080 [Paenibacillus curdlanolyticus]
MRSSRGQRYAALCFLLVQQKNLQGSDFFLEVLHLMVHKTEPFVHVHMDGLDFGHAEQSVTNAVD